MIKKLITLFFLTTTLHAAEEVSFPLPLTLRDSFIQAVSGFDHEEIQRLYSICTEHQKQESHELLLGLAIYTKYSASQNHEWALAYPEHEQEAEKITRFLMNQEDFKPYSRSLYDAAWFGMDGIVSLLCSYDQTLKKREGKGIEFDHPAKYTPFLAACKSGSIKTVDRLISYYSEQSPTKPLHTLLDQINNEGQTGLMLAVQDGTITMVVHLLKLGSNWKLKDYAGNSILHYLARDKQELHTRTGPEVLSQILANIHCVLSACREFDKKKSSFTYQLTYEKEGMYIRKTYLIQPIQRPGGNA